MNIDEIHEQLDSLYKANQENNLEEFLLSKIAEAVDISDSNVLIWLLNELIRFYKEIGEHKKCITYFNNMSLIFQEMGDYESACDCLERALGISLNDPQCRVEQAITYSNLATALVKLDRVDDAKDCLEKSVTLFQMDESPDVHFSVALSSLAEICYAQKDYANAVKNYEQVLYQIENSVGRNRAYEIVLSNIHVIKDELIEKIVKLEWEALNKDNNESDRTICQDDWETFSAMRKNQYLSWDVEMLESKLN